MRLKHDGFEDLIVIWWSIIKVSGIGSSVLREKTYVSKNIIRAWNKEVFGRWKERKKDAVKRLYLWDEIEYQRTVSSSEFEYRVEAMKDFIGGHFWKKFVRDGKEIDWIVLMYIYNYTNFIFI